MSVRAKFRVDAVKQVHWNKDVRVVELTAVYDDGTPENQRYAKATPSGSISLTIDNPPAAAQFELGKVFYLDFTPAG